MNGSHASRRDISALASVPSLWRAIAGFIVWSVAFVVLYVGHALGCLYVSQIMEGATLNAVLMMLWLAHVTVVAAMAWRSRRQWLLVRSRGGNSTHARFMWRVTFLIDIFAFGAVFITGLPVMMIPACAP